jgi:four helix bundle protein
MSGERDERAGAAKAAAKTYRDVVAWQKAHRFVLSVYRLTAKFPRHGLFGLTSQLRRAALSVPANIAEGFTRETDAEKLRFLTIARGSMEECSYYLLLSRDLGYGDTTEAEGDLEAASRLLATYAAPIRRRVRG